MRRPALLTALATGLPALVLLAPTGPAAAGDASCPTNDGQAVIQAQPGARYVWMVVYAGAADVITDRGPLCRIDTTAASSYRLGDTDGQVTAWSIDMQAPLPGPLHVANDAGDRMVLEAGYRTDDVFRSGAAEGVLLLDDAPRTRHRLTVAAVPSSLYLQMHLGVDSVDLTTGAGWEGDVDIDSTDRGRRAMSTHAAGAAPTDSLTVRLGAGDDSVLGTVGADVISSGAGDDEVYSSDGVDTVTAGAGDDLVRAGRARDLVSGGGGRDELSGDGAADRLLGGPGRDLLRAADGSRDELDGGADRDGAEWDAVDVRRSIEYRL